MLSECQECAIHLGNVIEKSEGEGLITISDLEKYCDNLFHIFEALQEEMRLEKVVKLLNKCLLRVENSVKNNIPIWYFHIFYNGWKKSSGREAVEAKIDPCHCFCNFARV